MRIEKQTLGFVYTNAYIAINEVTREVFVVDPGANVESFVQYFEEQNYALKGILLTHGHYDHIGGVSALIQKYECPLYALEAERDMLANPALNLSNTTRHGISLTQFIGLSDGQVLEIAGMTVKVIATPGHTSGGACYYIEENGVLFAGDTLFAESVGRTDLPTGSHGTLVRSIKERLFVLPEDTIVYPGHMSETTIEHEKQYNPFIR